MGIPIVGGIVSGVIDHAAEALLGQNTTACNLVKGAIKVGGAIVTCDVTAAMSGAKDLVTGAVGAAPAAVEFMGNIGGRVGIGGLAFGPLGMCVQAVLQQVSQGYAPKPAFDARAAQAVNLLQRDFDLLDTAAGIGGKDGIIGTVDLMAAASSSGLPSDLREACRFLLSNPSLRNQLDVAAGVGSVDGRITRFDLDAMERRLDAANPYPFPAPPPPSAPTGPTCPTPPTTPNPPPVPGPPGAPQPSGWDAQFDAALASLDRYFDFFDTAAGINGKDGIIGRCDLEAALRNPSLPPQLADACRFLLKNPAAWNQLDVGAGIGQVDGHIFRADIEAVRRRRATAPVPVPVPVPGGSVPSTTTTRKPASTSSRSKTPSASSSTKASTTAKTSSTAKSTSTAKTSTSSKSSKLSGMSAEQIVESMLLEMLNGLDSELIDKAKELEKAEASKTKAKSGSSAEKQATADYNRIYADIQKIAERRKQMYDLVSNLSKLGHDMARTAIGNIGR